jgi:6-phosphofructokinase
MTKVKGTIGILTGGGDVPGLNPAIRAVTFPCAKAINYEDSPGLGRVG